MILLVPPVSRKLSPHQIDFRCGFSFGCHLFRFSISTGDNRPRGRHVCPQARSHAARATQQHSRWKQLIFARDLRGHTIHDASGIWGDRKSRETRMADRWPRKVSRSGLAAVKDLPVIYSFVPGPMAAAEDGDAVQLPAMEHPNEARPSRCDMRLQLGSCGKKGKFKSASVSTVAGWRQLRKVVLGFFPA